MPRGGKRPGTGGKRPGAGRKALNKELVFNERITIRGKKEKIEKFKKYIKENNLKIAHEFDKMLDLYFEKK